MRYLLMCDQTGAITDDGVAARLADTHFYLTATTTGVDRAYQQMLVDSGFQPDVDSSADKFRLALESDLAQWTPIVTALGLKLS